MKKILTILALLIGILPRIGLARPEVQALVGAGIGKLEFEKEWGIGKNYGYEPRPSAYLGVKKYFGPNIFGEIRFGYSRTGGNHKDTFKDSIRIDSNTVVPRIGSANWDWHIENVAIPVYLGFSAFDKRMNVSVGIENRIPFDGSVEFQTYQTSDDSILIDSKEKSQIYSRIRKYVIVPAFDIAFVAWRSKYSFIINANYQHGIFDEGVKDWSTSWVTKKMSISLGLGI